MCNRVHLWPSMVYRGEEKPLEVEDLWGLNEEDKAERIFSDFTLNWELERAWKKQQRELPASPSLGANGMGKSTAALAMVKRCVRRKLRRSPAGPSVSGCGNRSGGSPPIFGYNVREHIFLDRGCELDVMR